MGRKRDLGSLNTELVAESGPLNSALPGTDSGTIEVDVDSVHVMEAVRVPGAKYVEYRSLCEIPLLKGATAPPPAASEKPPSPSGGMWTKGRSEGSSTGSERSSLAELLEDSESY